MPNPSWRIINIGHLSYNKYRDPVGTQRNQLCTSLLIETDSRRIVVDPGVENKEEYTHHLDRQTGYKPSDIDTVFLTHFHRHHWRSLSLFPKAVWIMSRTEIRWWKNKDSITDKEKNILAGFVPIEEFAIEGLESIPTPGHTHGHTSLLFETREGFVVVAGDAVLTFDHFDDREPSEHSEDIKAARRSLDQIAKMADLVIPGHDNFFVV